MNDSPQKEWVKPRIADLAESFRRELIARAQRGDAKAGEEILREIALAINAERFDVILFPFLADCLWMFLKDSIPLDRALCVEREDKGGRPPIYDQQELAALDLLLRYHSESKRSAGEAETWIEAHVGADRTTVQRARNVYKVMEAQKDDREALLYLSGSLRSIVATALPA